MDDYFIGLDIGGTNARAALAGNDVSVGTKVLKKPFVRMGNIKKEVEKNICFLIDEILYSNRVNIKSLKAVGISMAALFNRENGKIEYWPNNNLWSGFPLQEYLQKKYNVPFVFEDDANSAAVCELFMGSARGFDSYVYLTVGTGIGCGIILNRQIYLGTHGWAGEIGHSKVGNSNKKCKCGAYGCLQSLISGPVLLNRARELANIYNPFCTAGLSDLKAVVQFADSGEIWAKKVFEEAGGYLADSLVNTIMLLDLPLIVIGGGVSEAGDTFLEPFVRVLNAELISRKRNVLVKTTEFGDDSGAVGALLLARKLISSKYRRGNWNEFI